MSWKPVPPSTSQGTEQVRGQSHRPLPCVSPGEREWGLPIIRGRSQSWGRVFSGVGSGAAPRTHMHTHAHSYVHTYMHAHTQYVCAHMCAHGHRCTHTHACTCTQCTHMCTYSHMQTSTHALAHTCTHLFWTSSYPCLTSTARARERSLVCSPGGQGSLEALSSQTHTPREARLQGRRRKVRPGGRGPCPDFLPLFWLRFTQEFKEALAGRAARSGQHVTADTAYSCVWSTWLFPTSKRSVTCTVTMFGEG